MDGAKIHIFKERDKICLGGLLKGTDCGRLKAEICFEPLGNLSNKTLEGKFADEKFSGFLITTNFTKSNSSRSVAMGLLDSAGSWRTLASGLGSELFARCFTSSGFAGSLLSSNHVESLC